eukprot:5746398-Pleurochrysis_carterae.AAC.1
MYVLSNMLAVQPTNCLSATVTFFGVLFHASMPPARGVSRIAQHIAHCIERYAHCVGDIAHAVQLSVLMMASTSTGPSFPAYVLFAIATLPAPSSTIRS